MVIADPPPHRRDRPRALPANLAASPPVGLPLVFVGQSPGRKGADLPALSGACGARIAAFAGLSGEPLERLYTCMNLVGAFLGKAGKGDKFSAPVARETARRLLASPEPVALILLGRHVARAFGLRAYAWFRWYRVGAREQIAAVIPHPSGVNLWYNDPRHRAEAAAFLVRAVDDNPPLRDQA